MTNTDMTQQLLLALNSDVHKSSFTSYNSIFLKARFQIANYKFRPAFDILQKNFNEV